MEEIKYVYGSIVEPQQTGTTLILHLCNDKGRWLRGIMQLLSTKWPNVHARYRKWYSNRFSLDFKLGKYIVQDVEDDVKVVSILGQHGVLSGDYSNIPVRYGAVEQALHDIAIEFKDVEDVSVHIPKLGCETGGGTWDRMKPIIEKTLLTNDIPVTVYE